jgi:hypothetical protein
MASNYDRALEEDDGDGIAYALVLAMNLSMFVAATAGDLATPFVPHRWLWIADLAAAAPVLALAARRRWQLLDACLELVWHVRRR